MIRRVALVVGLLLLGAAPARAQADGGETWIDVKGSRAVVFRPADGTPRPGVLILHGTEGLKRHHVQLAKDLAAKGFVVMAACWFAGHWEALPGGGARPATPPDGIACPKAQKLEAKLPVPAPMLTGIKPLVDALRKQPGVNGKVALFGHSRGAIAAFQLGAQRTGDAIVGSGGFPLGLAPIRQPVAMLQGTNDPFSPLALTKAFEQALKGPKQATYYQGGGHRILFEEPTRSDAIAKAAAFLHKHLG